MFNIHYKADKYLPIRFIIKEKIRQKDPITISVIFAIILILLTIIGIIIAIRYTTYPKEAGLILFCGSFAGIFGTWFFAWLLWEFLEWYHKENASLLYKIKEEKNKKEKENNGIN